MCSYGDLRELLDGHLVPRVYGGRRPPRGQRCSRRGLRRSHPVALASSFGCFEGREPRSVGVVRTTTLTCVGGRRRRRSRCGRGFKFPHGPHLGQAHPTVDRSRKALTSGLQSRPVTGVTIVVDAGLVRRGGVSERRAAAPTAVSGCPQLGQGCVRKRWNIGTVRVLLSAAAAGLLQCDAQGSAPRWVNGGAAKSQVPTTSLPPHSQDCMSSQTGRITSKMHANDLAVDLIVTPRPSYRCYGIALEGFQRSRWTAREVVHRCWLLPRNKRPCNEPCDLPQCTGFSG